MKVHYLITITDPFDHFARWKTKLFYRTELHSNHSSLLPILDRFTEASTS